MGFPRNCLKSNICLGRQKWHPAKLPYIYNVFKNVIFNEIVEYTQTHVTYTFIAHLCIPNIFYYLILT